MLTNLVFCEFEIVSGPDEYGRYIYYCPNCDRTTLSLKVHPDDIRRRRCITMKERYERYVKHKQYEKIRDTRKKEMQIEPAKIYKQDLLSLIKRYGTERATWIAANKPVRSEEEIARLYDEFCQPCEFRNKGRCGICGCFIKRKGYKFNKLAWRTTRCPNEPPKWEASVKINIEEKRPAMMAPSPPQITEQPSSPAQTSPAPLVEQVVALKKKGCGCS